MSYAVRVTDNFHRMEDGESYPAGEFETAEAAIAHAKQIVDQCLAGLYPQICEQRKSETPLTADELYGYYMAFGEDPCVVAADRTVVFAGWRYARERCAEMVVKSPLKVQ